MASISCSLDAEASCERQGLQNWLVEEEIQRLCEKCSFLICLLKIPAAMKMRRQSAHEMLRLAVSFLFLLQKTMITANNRLGLS